MFAVIKTGGKQYRVSEGDEFNIEKLEVEKGDLITFNQVLAVGEGETLRVGTPVVDGVVVEAKVITQGKGKKVIIFKKKRRKGYQVKRGHRQLFTRVRITAIKG